MKLPNTTRRAFLGGGALAASALLAACGGSSDGGGGDAPAFDGAITGTYDMHVTGYDWGCGVDQITLSLSAPLDTADAESFTITEHKQATDWTSENLDVVEADFPRTVTGVAIDGNTVTIDLYCSPSDGSPFNYAPDTGRNTWCDPYELNIALAEGAELTSDGTAVTSFAIEPVAAAKATTADVFSLGSFDAADGVTYQYAAYTPEGESKNLVVWLHGGGEGGDDPTIVLLANKVVALAEEDFQQAVGGAHVLVPQCPTLWMDVDGKGTFITTENTSEAKSFYTASLEELIDSYAGQVGAEKVFLCGCSNGGFMTLLLSLLRPDAYVGAVPICEALYDSLITDDQIAGLKDLPLYFVWSKDDTTVDPATSEEPTIERLRASGKSAETLHVSTTDHVIDTSGEYTNEDGTPYQYAGHWSWIYFYNNECECDDDGLKVFDFAAECLK